MGTTADPPKLMQATIDLAQRAFDGLEFRQSVASMIDRLVQRDVEIDDRIIETLLGWVTTDGAWNGEHSGAPEAAEPAMASDLTGSAERDILAQSLLWEGGSALSVPGGLYAVLETLARIYIRQGDTGALRHLLLTALQRMTDGASWRCLLMTLASLRPHDEANRSDEILLLELVIDGVPGLVGTKELARLLGYVNGWAPDLVERVLMRWDTVDSAPARQGFGELVALMTLLHPDRSWPMEQQKKIELDPADGDARAGVALTAVNFWREPQFRAEATATLLRLMPQASPNEWAAVFELFRLVEELTPEPNTIAVLEAIAARLEHLEAPSSPFVVERLGSLLPHEAGLVGRLANGLAEKWRGQLGDVSTSVSSAAPDLVDIAVTLHRLGSATRDEGLCLFERLLDINAYGARTTLDQIDSRFRRDAGHLRPRLPRRRRRHRPATG